MTQTSLTIAYDGDALADGSMEVRDLAPALLSLGRLLERANHVVNGEQARLSVRVVAGFQPGSFEIDLQIIQSWLREVRDILAGDTASSITNLIALLGLGSGGTFGLFQLIKRLKGKRPAAAVTIVDGSVRLDVPGEAPIVVPKPVLDLLQDAEVRREAAASLAPLKQPGVDRFEARPAGRKGPPSLSISSEEAPYFDPPYVEDGAVVSEEGKAAFRIARINFRGDKWQLDDGRGILWVRVADQAFLKRLEQNEIAFSRDDVLICKVRREQKTTTSGIRSDTTILQLLEHRRAARQLEIPLNEPDAD